MQQGIEPGVSPALSILRAVRRCLVLFLLVLLPLQMSWAAVAEYCGHASGTDAAHFGHHGHEDHAHAAPAESPSGSPEEAAAGKTLDADCGHCHSHCVGVLLMPAAPALGALAIGFGAAADEAARAQPPTPPERPQWRGLA